ncbi:hypothetical protein GX50_08813 [[Emmonsia] crescens]|uniref:BTB domain-containing protein n=1 Tax=[Emmonsia] crescens TaxID=73230 RepID=A0A2B7Z6K1_9EURO|nr:hypothetical protein GX50_08813 [Emmonsia crescens]
MSATSDTCEPPYAHLLSQKYSDMTISCGANQYHVHRVVVCNQSPFFAAALDKQFKEATSAEVVLEEDDPELVRLMVAHFYGVKDPDEINVLWTERSDVGNNATPTIEEEESSTEKEKETAAPTTTEESYQALLNARLYTMGDRYGIEGLKTHSKTEFDTWATNVDVVKYIDEFAPIIDEVFKSTPSNDRGLRDIAVPLIADNAQAALKNQELCDMLLQLPELQMEILRLVVESKADLTKRLTATSRAGKKEVFEFKKYVEGVDRSMTEVETSLMELGKKTVALSREARKRSQRVSNPWWSTLDRHFMSMP